MENSIREIKWSWDNFEIQDILLKYYKEWIFNSQDEADAMVERIVSLAGIKSPGKVVDIGCGLGYHAKAFSEKGFDVFAFDPGNRYTEIADQINQNDKRVEIKTMTCSELDSPATFSLAWAGWYCPGQLTDREVVADFKRIYDSLCPGGWFVSNVAGKQKIPPMDSVKNWRQLSDCFALSEKRADETFFYEESWFIYPEKNETIKIVEVERMYSLNDILPLLAEAGFKDIISARTLKGDEPAKEGEYFAFWCRKP